MSDPQAVAVDDQAVDEQRPETQKPDSDAGDGGQRRRLLSLSSQKRRPQERVAKTKDSKPPEDDPMARALELLSGIDENVRDAERPVPGAEPETGTKAEVAADSTADSGAATDAKAEGDEPATAGDGAARAASGVAVDAVTAFKAFGQVAEDAADEEEEAELGRYEEVIRREDASPVVAKEAKRNPAKALYSLQEVHERTGIPYATLALYAANHSDRIPSLGERRSPAYPRQGLEEFCRIHSENHPEWERPAAGTEAGWDDQDGLARRIEVLAEGLDELHSDLREINSIVRRGWTAEVNLFD